MNNLQTCQPHLSDVATLPWEIQKKSFSTFLFKTSDYLHYLRRKQIATVVLQLYTVYRSTTDNYTVSQKRPPFIF